MQFIKENLFYSVLVAIILVVGGAVVAMGFTGAGSTDAKQALIVKNATAIVDLYRGEKVNQAKIGAKKEDVRRSGELLERTADNAVKWSKGRYQPIVVPKMEGGKKVGDVRAFPIDAKAYQKYDVPYFASGRYIALMNTIFEPLGPTVPPTRAEIEVEVERLKAIEDKNIERKKLEEAWKKRAAEIRGEGTEGVEDGVDPAPLRPGGVPIPPRGLPGGVPGRGAVPDRGQPDGQTTPARDYGLIGQNNMRLFKAGIAVPDLGKTPKAASIYIDPDALDKVFAAAAAEATDVDLWEAQVHLWIVEDIVSVIAKINAEALKASGKAAATVPDSAIKRLIEISVPKGYVVSNASVDAMPRGAPGRNFRPGREPVPGRGPRGVGDGLGGGSGSETLPRRATNTTYDVKHYTVTVVMNVRYLPALQMLLLRDNQHTILNITMDSVDASDAGGDLHYYGTGAVMKVTLQGELLMLADWTRGRWESTAGKTSAPTPAGGRGRGGRSDVRRAAPVAGQWSKTYPPLMPAKVLAEIHNLNPAALRPADTQRMNDGSR